MRFVINDNETITDKQTGLVWSNDGITKKANWYDCLSIVTNCNKNEGYLGFTDWRMPTRTELESLINHEVIYSVKYLKQEGFIGLFADCYWSNTYNTDAEKYGLGTDCVSAWFVDFGKNISSFAYITNKYYLKLVRGGK